MSSYNVKITWKRKQEEPFIDLKYSRVHTWYFDGGIELKASSSPHVVAVPMSDESAVDPEEAFVASISSCHMLWFLAIAAGKKYIIESYEDNAEGVLNNTPDGRLAMTEVTLKPRIIFTGDSIPSRVQINELHHLAHDMCYISNSVKTNINIVQVE